MFSSIVHSSGRRRFGTAGRINFRTDSVRMHFAFCLFGVFSGKTPDDGRYFACRSGCGYRGEAMGRSVGKECGDAPPSVRRAPLRRDSDGVGKPGVGGANRARRAGRFCPRRTSVGSTCRSTETGTNPRIGFAPVSVPFRAAVSSFEKKVAPECRSAGKNATNRPFPGRTAESSAEAVVRVRKGKSSGRRYNASSGANSGASKTVRPPGENFR